MNTLHLKTGDTAIVLSGKEKGKQGKVMRVDPKKGMVVVEGVNFVTRHAKPRSQTDPGGLIRQEAPLRACKVMRVCPKCNKPTRPAFKFLTNGDKSQICKHCGNDI